VVLCSAAALLAAACAGSGKSGASSGPTTQVAKGTTTVAEPKKPVPGEPPPATGSKATAAASPKKPEPAPPTKAPGTAPPKPADPAPPRATEPAPPRSTETAPPKAPEAASPKPAETAPLKAPEAAPPQPAGTVPTPAPAAPDAPVASDAPVAPAVPAVAATEPGKVVVPPVAGSARLPASIDMTLPNGMKVFLVPDAEVPVVAFSIRLAGGAAEDRPGEEGATSLLAALLTKGAAGRDAAKFQEDVDFVGGTFTAAAAPRWISVRATFLKADTDLALELLSDVVRNPRLDAAEFEKERGLAVDSLAAAREEPETLMPLYWATWIFGKHPLGTPVTGDERTLAALTLERVKAAAQRSLAPGRAWLVVAGDFDPGTMRQRIIDRFGPWTGTSSPPATLVAPAPLAGGRVLLVDDPEALQTHFRFGNHGIDRSHPDFPARFLVNTLLGGRFTSRLNQALRIDTGLTYGAHSAFDDDAFGAFRVATYAESAKSEEAMDLALAVYRRCVEQGITEEELVSARNYVKGQFAADNLETAEQQGSMILSLAFDGLPRDLVERLYERMDQVGLDDANRVLRERFPKNLDWVVIGRGADLRKVVAKFGKVTEVPVAEPGFGPR